MPAGYVLKPPFKPLLNDKAIEFLESIVQPYWLVFEYGSGSSTMWFGERVRWIWSVESNLQWYEAIRDIDVKCNAGITHHPATKQEESEKYAGLICDFMNDSFDLVFVDGDARPLCIRDARAKVKPGGWMLVDDVQWNPVKNALHLLDEWEKVATSKGLVFGSADGLPRMNTTAFYRKPT